MSAEDALFKIQEILSGREWSAETPAQIAGVMEAAGYEIEDID